MQPVMKQIILFYFFNGCLQDRLVPVITAMQFACQPLFKLIRQKSASQKRMQCVMCLRNQKAQAPLCCSLSGNILAFTER